MNILSLLLLISTVAPITKELDIIHLNVAVGEVNGSLTLGTLGYCLKVSDQNICPSPHKLPYAISQSFSNHRISRLVLIFCDFKDNPQVLAQLTKDANRNIGVFSIANLVGLVSGAFVTLCFAYGTGCARLEDILPPQRLSEVTLKHISAIGAAICSSLSLVSAFTALLFELILTRNQIRKSIGAGFWFTFVIFLVFTITVFHAIKTLRLLKLHYLIWTPRPRRRN